MQRGKESGLECSTLVSGHWFATFDLLPPRRDNSRAFGHLPRHGEPTKMQASLLLHHVQKISFLFVKCQHLEQLDQFVFDLASPPVVCDRLCLLPGSLLQFLFRLSVGVYVLLRQ